ncbi:hypothetical protein EDC61_103172 [Sulfuritortus calidifontis]|uniref:Phosphoglycerate mutase n=1 Tax=Sulfuritortus calidifontis TaxID=1914471 RepID=A0A4R3JZN7_9PROT|nr:hypothetical protein [Sulfuritortus calidifontis]TCS73049.1 hypothetical protein EDC61_103172 [Sulfuritortus calidifontis]
MLHLIIPQLLGHPDEVPTPALAALLARGGPAPSPPASPAEALCRAAGLADCPLAALSAADDGADIGDACWLRADPIYLHLNIDQLVLTDPRGLGLGSAESAALAASLNRHFAADGLELLPLAPDRWYLKLERAPALQTTPLTQVVDQGIDRHLPRGADARRWRSVMNEAQMLLHEHPVNQAREAQGLPPVNSLWLWGGGRLNAASQSRIASCYADAPSAQALARACGLPCQVEPTGLAELGPIGQETLVVLNGLRTTPANERRERLRDYERRWFAPLLRALQQGRVGGLDLIGTGPRPVQVSLDRRAAWRIWRR